MQRYVLMRVAPSSLRRLVIFAEKKHTVLRAMQSSSRSYRPVSQRMLVGQDYFLHVGAVIVIDIVARV